MSEQNKILVRQAVEEVWNRADFTNLDKFIASDFVAHLSASGDELYGPEGIRQYYTELHTAFPDIHFTIKDQIAERDRVVTYWTAQGTHKGEYQGIAPTGKKFRLAGTDIDRIVNGKVVECWPMVDELGLLQQLGVVPRPEPAGQPQPQKA